MHLPMPTGSIVVLSGAGLSAASGVPTFRDPGGLWEGHRPEDLATPEAFARDPDQVRRFYDMRRRKVKSVRPNPGHDALVRLQAAWGPERVVLVTQNVDGLLQRAASLAACPVSLIEMHGSLLRLRCASDAGHPRVAISGDQPVDRRCARCAAPMRPAVVWFGEVPERMGEIESAVRGCSLFLAVGTSGVVYPAAGYGRLARASGARCVEVNPHPTGGVFHDAIASGAEIALPQLVDAWVGE